MRRGDTGADPIASRGAVGISIRRAADGKHALIRLKLAPGWHVNSEKTRSGLSCCQRAFLWRACNPMRSSSQQAISRKLAVADTPLKLFEGEVEVKAALPEGKAANAARRVTLGIQACSDRICLAPETVMALLPAKGE